MMIERDLLMAAVLAIPIAILLGKPTDPSLLECPNGIMPGEIVHHKTDVAGIVEECWNDTVLVETAQGVIYWKFGSVIEFEAMEVIE